MNYNITHETAVAILMSMHGLREVPGEKNNPAIVEMFKDIGHEWVQSDETAWCTATMNYCLKNGGYEYSPDLDARSYMGIGEPVKYPNPGDIVVFWRIDRDAWQGHVGMFVRKSGSYIYTYGGNQTPPGESAGQICITAYPEQSDHFGLLGYRQMRFGLLGYRQMRIA